jgi:hypothetical protein
MSAFDPGAVIGSIKIPQRGGLQSFTAEEYWRATGVATN